MSVMKVGYNDVTLRVKIEQSVRDLSRIKRLQQSADKTTDWGVEAKVIREQTYVDDASPKPAAQC